MNGDALATEEPTGDERPRFGDFLAGRVAGSPLPADEAVAAVAPLFRQVIAAHEAGRVAPLEGVEHLFVADGLHLWFEDGQRRVPREAPEVLRRLERPLQGPLDVVAEVRQVDDVESGRIEEHDLTIGRPGDEIVRPVYLPGYRTWEHRIGHHDALTDVLSLGLILASLACGLDLRERQDLERLVRWRHNLFQLAPGLNPVLAQAIARMTELGRRRRAQDLPGLLRRLERYREIDVDVEFDVTHIPGFLERDTSGRRRAVLSRLEERLYEISRRNPLLFFKPRANTLNLTLASVPLSFNPDAIRPESLLAWWPWLREKLAAGKTLVLDSYLRFDEATYLPATLDKIRLEAGRDEKELGFANLRLIVAFLRWHNLKETPEERIDSPLVLLPVKLARKRGIRDRYLLEPLSATAEVNPVLRHQLLRLYDIRLPESIDLEATDLDRFFTFLEDQVRAGEPGVTLSKVDRPRVKLIHGQARRRQEQYLSRLRRAGRLRSYLDLDYSYRADDFQPLGLRLFEARVRPVPLHLEQIVSRAKQRPFPRISPAGEAPAAPESVRERKLAALFEGGETHPYAWEFDLTSLTLGNFRYRKMTLVRDYDALISEDRANEVFDSIFSVAPRPVLEPAAALPLAERFPVLPCDPTQASAIGAARRGASYIIQGPPGTGKSQTIANLIADFAARGERVLFVCQKRAAIDVVWLRLKKLGLHRLCCLVHDAQADKKEVIHDLRRTHQRFAEQGEGAVPTAEPDDDAPRREKCLERLTRTLEPLLRFDAAMRSTEAAGVPVWELLARLVELRHALPGVEAAERESLPQYSSWTANRGRLERLAEDVRELRADGVFSRHTLAVLAPGLAERDRPYETISRGMERARGIAGELEAVLGELPLDSAYRSSLGAVRELLDFAREVEPFTRRGLLALVDPESQLARTLAVDLAKYRRQETAWKDVARKNDALWLHKLSARDTGVAMDLARGLEERTFPFLQPDWWRLRRILGKSYDWSAHQVRPTWLAVLQQLWEEHLLEQELRETERELAVTYGWEEVAELDDRVAALRESSASWPAGPAALCRGVLAAAEPREAERRLAALDRTAAVVDALESQLAEVVADPGSLDLGRLDETFGAVDGALGDLDDALPCLAHLAQLPEPLARAIRERPWTLEELEAAAAERSLGDVYRAERPLARFDARERGRFLERLAGQVEDYYHANAAHVRETARAGFLRRSALARASAAGLGAEEKALKHRYGLGLRQLEHEFGKQMRYKSIRDLWSGPAGEVMRDLKPVWLMSPLSISDTLPLTHEHFDVVIFDEASQVPVEEAVPALFRARQTIVVGDEMQLPPTSFFAARSQDDELLVVEDEGDLVEYDLSSNSFLNQAAKRLPSTYLGWHYRSRSEALISFSNAAFYGGRLLTVPEEELPRPAPEIRIESAEDGERATQALLERSVSFHFLPHGLYDKRRNTPEAEHVAFLVAGLLARGNGLSLGVVAFSEAQQDEIELALERLARRDPDFRRRLDAEYEREEDGEFVGLLVKNLENIQGDERDVVILSVCYGPAADGRVRMNFGPINQEGGEKRLNVAFSRAKHHMALVSSMRHTQIANVYNDGARCLRGYLRFADSVSTGDVEAAGRVLEELTAWRGSTAPRPARHPVVEDLAVELAARGFRVDRQVGRSVFRCDLAVCRPGDRTYRLGVLVDTAEHYRQLEVMERDLMRPRLLEAFGWRIEAVLTKDWHGRRQHVLDRVLERLAEAPPD